MFLALEHTGLGQVFYATTLSAGFDFCASEAHIIPAGEWKVVRTGMRIVESSTPQDMLFGTTYVRCVPEIQIRPRSGLAAKHGITVLNAPSTIDADYRGEIMVCLINHGKEPFSIQPGDRIAQGVCALGAQIPGIEVRQVERGTGGFGSSGKN